jgi:hypothetical protein
LIVQPWGPVKVGELLPLLRYGHQIASKPVRTALRREQLAPRKYFQGQLFCPG